MTEEEFTEMKEIIEDVDKIRTPENIALLRKIPASKLRYAVIAKYKRIHDKNTQVWHIDACYNLYERPFDESGNKITSYEVKRKLLGSYKSGSVAWALAWKKNFLFHSNFCKKLKVSDSLEK